MWHRIQKNKFHRLKNSCMDCNSHPMPSLGDLLSLLGRGYFKSQGNHTLLVKVSLIRSHCSNCVCRWCYCDRWWQQGDVRIEGLSNKIIWNQRSWKSKILPRNWSCRISIGNFYFQIEIYSRLLWKMDMAVSKPIDTLINANHQLGKKQGMYYRMIRKFI